MDEQNRIKDGDFYKFRNKRRTKNWSKMEKYVRMKAEYSLRSTNAWVETPALSISNSTPLGGALKK